MRPRFTPPLRRQSDGGLPPPFGQAALSHGALTHFLPAPLLADGAKWLAALLGGLTAGGATLWGLLDWFGRSP
ncbi:hypothetical protein GCM10010404_61490 [Nonomuraea africana]